MTALLPETTLDRALERTDAIWHPESTAHQFILGATGSGKTTLAQAILATLAAQERLVVFEPKQTDDPVWNGPPGDPWHFGRPVATITEQFGFRGEPGGGPNGLWFRVEGTQDRTDTSRRFASAMKIIEAEGRTVVLLDDVVSICRDLGCAEQVRSILSLGRSAAILAILSSTESSYVEGRSQAGIRWLGTTNGLPAAKAGAAMLGRSGRAWWEACAAIEPWQWIYTDSAPGNAGPVLVTPLSPYSQSETTKPRKHTSYLPASDCDALARGAACPGPCQRREAGGTPGQGGTPTGLPRIRRRTRPVPARRSCRSARRIPQA